MYLPLLLKALALCGLSIMVRGTLPRYRFDHLINLTWKHFLFLWVACLALNAGLLIFALVA
jgi:NADH:ubiquinone oxidoreductase subunit H